MSRQFKGCFLVILSAVLFGINPLISKQVYAAGGTAPQLTFLRALFAVPMLFLLNRAVKAPLRLTRQQLRAVFWVSLPSIATGLLLFSSYQYIPSGLATTLHFTYPIIVVLICALFLHQRVTAVKLLCVGLCTAGILAFYEPGGAVAPLGVALALASGVTYAGYTVGLAQEVLRPAGVFVLPFWLFAFNAAEGALVLAVGKGFPISLTPAGWGWAALFALLNAVAASVCYQAGVKLIGSQQTAILSTFEPITSILVGVLVYQEPFGLRTVVGSGLILAAVVLLTRFGAEKDSPAPAAGDS